jgi:hypothetical protein
MFAYELNNFPKRKNGPILCDLQGEMFVCFEDPEPTKTKKRGKKKETKKFEKIYVMNADCRELEGIQKTNFQYRDVSSEGELSKETKEITCSDLMKALELK